MFARPVERIKRSAASTLIKSLITHDVPEQYCLFIFAYRREHHPIAAEHSRVAPLSRFVQKFSSRDIPHLYRTMVRSHQKLTARVEPDKICFFLIFANDVKTPFGNERNRRPHLPGRNVNERCMIIVVAACYRIRSAVGTEMVLIDKARVDVCYRLHRQILQIQQSYIFTGLNETKPPRVRTKI